MPPTDMAMLRSFQKPVLALWPYLTRPELLERWLGPAEVELVPDGELQANLWNGDAVRGTVLGFAPPGFLDLAWRGGGPDVTWRLRIRLEHEGPGCRIRVEHEDPGSDVERMHVRAWWRAALSALRTAVHDDRGAHEWGDSLPIVLRAPLRRSASEVWPLLATASGLETWMAGAEHFEAVPGAAFRFKSRFQGSEIIEEGRVAAMEPERLLALDWEWMGQGWETPTRVELRLEPDPSGVALVLAHSGFDRLSPETRLHARRNYAPAWRDVLQDLRDLLAPAPAG
jgi:uncharacterized protein YndB with AHSA1/START domain